MWQSPNWAVVARAVISNMAKKLADMTPEELVEHERKKQARKVAREKALRLSEKAKYKKQKAKPFNIEKVEYEGMVFNFFTGSDFKVTPQEIIEGAIEYFEWNEENPIITEEHSHFKGEAIPYDVNKKRAVSLGRCILRLGLCHQTWCNYKKLEEEKHGELAAAYFAACNWVEEAIRTIKLEDAHAGLMNPAIVMRELGLRDAQKLVTDDGEGGDAPMNPVVFLPSNGREVVDD